MSRGRLALRLLALFVLLWFVSAGVELWLRHQFNLTPWAVLADLVLAPLLVPYGLHNAVGSNSSAVAVLLLLCAVAPYVGVWLGLLRPDLRSCRWLAYGAIGLWWGLLNSAEYFGRGC